MPKFEKGSAEAKAWGEKMKAAREAKKKLSEKGSGVGKSKVAPVDEPVKMPVLNKYGKVPKMNDRQKVSYDHIINNYSDWDLDDLIEFRDYEINRSKNPKVTGWGHDHDVGSYIAILKLIHDKSNISGRGKDLKPNINIVIDDNVKNTKPDNNTETIKTTKPVPRKISGRGKEQESKLEETKEEQPVATPTRDMNAPPVPARVVDIDNELHQINNIVDSIIDDEIEVPIETYLQYYQGLDSRVITLLTELYGIAGRTTNLRERNRIQRVINKALRISRDIDYMLLNREDDELTDTEDFKVGGGKLRNPFKKIEKGLWKAQDVMSQANPFSNKGFRQAGVKTGDVTNRQLLPAVTEAGMPLLYATAGTAGMMTGGPVGSLAAIRGTQMLYDKMVTSKGYDPRDRQQDAILKAISSEAGKQGASELKSSASVPKGKGIGRPKKKIITMLHGKPVILVEGKSI